MILRETGPARHAPTPRMSVQSVQNTRRRPNRMTRSVAACVVVICPKFALPSSPFGFENVIDEVEDLTIDHDGRSKGDDGDEDDEHDEKDRKKNHKWDDD